MLTPTPEIALQVAALARTLSPGPPAAALVGGSDERADAAALRSKLPALVVDTPGRVTALNASRALRLHHVHLAVNDEADVLLQQPSFAGDIAAICDALPQSRQTLAFSATFPPSLRAAHAMLKIFS